MFTFNSRLRVSSTFRISPLIVLVIVSACSDSSESGATNTPNVNRAVANRVENSPVVQTSPPVTVNNNLAVANSVKPGASAAKQPTPHIGTGGDDLSLFTQVRGALSSDKELSTAVIVEIKEGVVTLNGNLSSPAQKAKAETLVKNVSGVKSVKNNLRAAS
ncbi:MAG: BON domain-containing protein [Pyrinomonadaceae bacterium]